ncbi:MAG: tRNA pseudouridine(38-40) synthase TruA [Chloroflexi bacterium]|nr:tRNA pseudouridine(38-40) synthase TruA [Chloroflexota bacterium]
MDSRRVLAILEYDGTDFEGFQIQRRGRTVQGELERVLERVTGERVRIVGGGRTDSGVHALGQGAHFDTTWKHPLDALQRALNAELPRDLAVRSIIEVDARFSARRSAKSRLYRYTILNRPVRSPLLSRYTLLVPETLDAAAMNRAAHVLVGVHDFRSFGTAPRGTNTVRRTYSARVERSDEDRILISLEANAFLYRMVRRIVGTLLWVGKGEMSLEGFQEVIAGKRRAGDAAGPQGLALVAIKYDLTTEPGTIIGVKNEDI